MTQSTLFEKIQLPKSAISQYLAGKFEPKQKALFVLSEALDVSIPWLMWFDVPMNNPYILRNQVPLPVGYGGNNVDSYSR